MIADDYDSVAKLWTNSSGVGVNPDDSKENISKYLQRNPATSFVAVENGGIVGAILKEKGAMLIQLQAVNDDHHNHFYGKLGYKDATNLTLKTKIL